METMSFAIPVTGHGETTAQAYVSDAGSAPCLVLAHGAGAGQRHPFMTGTARALNARGIDTLIDGAHAPGMIPLNVREIGAAYYTGNLHKWVCAPKGAAFLYVRENRRYAVRPISISHGANSQRTDRSRYLIEFDWTGTWDPTAYLAVPEALRFIESLVPGGWAEIMRRNHELVLRGRDIVANALNVAPPVPDDMLRSMASLPLPDADPNTPGGDQDPLHNRLLDEFNIEVPVMPWPHHPKRLIRISAQVYNSIEDYERLASALHVVAK